MDTAPLTAPSPSNVAGNVDSILVSIAALSLSAGNAQRLITAIHDNFHSSGAADEDRFSGGASSEAATEPVGPTPAPLAPAAASTASTDAVATPTPVVAPVTAAVAPASPILPTTVAPVAALPVLPAVTAPVVAAPPVPPAVAPVATVAVVDPIAAAPVLLPQPPQLPHPVLPVVPTGHFTASHRGVLYLLPLQDVPRPYYLITKGRSIGVVTDWNRASPLVTGVKGAIFHKVATVGQGVRGMMSAIDDNTVEYL